MSFETFVRAMPKAELHVHLEGSIQPETLLTLAKRNNVPLPADTLEGLRAWYRFDDFNHFMDVYDVAANCICTPDDIELVAREFLAGQAAQNVSYTEVVSTMSGRYTRFGMAFHDQLAAINRARDWAAAQFDVHMGVIVDIERGRSFEVGMLVAGFAIEAMGDGVVALGLGGHEAGHAPSKFAGAYALARASGLPSVPHAGEMVGPDSIWAALNDADAVRIHHGVRCLEDDALVEQLRSRQIPLDVALSSNVALGVVGSLTDHPLPRLLDAGLFVTLNSDDPAMFNTTLTDEYLLAATTFGLGTEDLQKLSLAAVKGSLLPENGRNALAAQFEEDFTRLRAEHLP
jgi:aminodeoxyfutalosine deaminase